MQELMMLTPVVGTFSGVSYEHLTRTPILGAEAVLEIAAADLIGHGRGTELAVRDGEQVALVTGDAFCVALQSELKAGDYSLIAAAAGPEKGSESFWVEVDSKRVDTP